MKKKLIAIALCAALAAGGVIAGSLAYFTDHETVTNTFTVGDINITLDETKVDKSGEIITGEGAGKTEDGNAYHLLPGHEYVKDPTVHVQRDSEDCYVFVKVDNHLTTTTKTVECNGMNGMNGMNGTVACQHTNCATIAAQMTANGWIALNETEHQGIYVYGTTNVEGVIVPGAVVAKDKNNIQDLKVFEKFRIDGDVINTELAEYATEKNAAGNPTGDTVTVTAYAVQKDGFTSAEQAWEATFGNPTP